MRFIGDTHGDFNRYKELIQNVPCSLQVGDFGLMRENDLKDIPTDPNHKFFRGNHDNPQLCKVHPCYLSDLVYLEKQEMFVMAGGFSIDKGKRIIGKDWWEDEELSWGDLYEAINLYTTVKPRIVVSHECPTAIKPAAIGRSVFNPKITYTSRTENALQTMLDAHKPEIWIFGHYHFKLDYVLDGTRFICLADHRQKPEDQVFEIEGLTW